MKVYRKRLAELIRSHCPEGPITGAEIGVASGKLSQHLLSRMPNVRLIMVDRWEPPEPDSPYALTQDSFAVKTAEGHERNFDLAFSRTNDYDSRRVIMRRESSVAALEVALFSLHFVFIDADHSEEGCAADLEAWWPRLRPGGLFCGHDYLPGNKEWGVVKAVDRWAKKQNLPVGCADGKIWWVLRPK